MLTKKLIEVALPLDAINAASAREKSIRHGHPSTLHLWWARRPLAAARAVIFAQMVDDPSEYVDELLADPDKRRRAEAALDGAPDAVDAGACDRGDADTGATPPERLALSVASPPGAGGDSTLREKAAEVERERLFGILRELVLWENTTNEELLERARAEIRRSWRRACERNAGHPRAAELFDPEKLPAFHDPFAGGGALPLEAQRLGLEAHASDLNPVAVLINKAMIEIPPKFAGRPPVNPEFRGLVGKSAEVGPKAGKRRRRQARIGSEQWRGARGLAEDVRYYGRWMREEAEKRIGHLYPKVEVTPEMVRERPDLEPYEGRKLTVIAWLWARTVKSPNPAFADVEVPLVSTFMLSTKKGKEAYVEPVIEGRGYRFEVRAGVPEDTSAAKRGTKRARGANFECVMSGSPIASNYVKAESMAGRMGARLMAVVAEGDRGRVYLEPTVGQEHTASQASPAWKPDEEMNRDTRDLVSGRGYGFFTWADLFTSRQLVALTTFSDLVGEAMERIRLDAAEAAPGHQRHGGRFDASRSDAASLGPAAKPSAAAASGVPLRDDGAGRTRRIQSDDGAAAAGLPDDGRPLRDGGVGAAAYAEAVGLYLAFALSKQADLGNSLCRWEPVAQCPRQLFGRQAIPMIWDFAEGNPLGASSGSWSVFVDGIVRAFSRAFGSVRAGARGRCQQADAGVQKLSQDAVVSTDPPYYDNIGYADLSDFFYVWLRRSLKSTLPELFATLTVPKADELVATPYRHGSKEAAESFFLDGMSKAMESLAGQAHFGFPVTIYYAFKQSERKRDGGTASTGWETFLGAVIRSRLSITGTWPMRTENASRMIGMATNALASSIVLVCRPRPADAPLATRREFLSALRAELPQALRLLRTGNVAPVDLAQAAIGPGMAVYTRYARVLHASGADMAVLPSSIGLGTGWWLGSRETNARQSGGPGSSLRGRRRPRRGQALRGEETSTLGRGSRRRAQPAGGRSLDLVSTRTKPRCLAA